MAIEIKEKGNIYNIGLMNNVAQANTEISNEINIKNELKTGPLAFIKAVWGNCTLDYIANYIIKRNETFKKINNSIENKVPEIYYSKPRLNIVGPVIDNLKYNLDEKQIKEMYTNLLVKESDNRTQNKVLPAYIEIIKQLSQDDAVFIKILSGLKEKNIFIKQILLKTNLNLINEGEKIFLLNDNQVIKMSEAVIDNLKRIQILECSSEEVRPALYNNDKLIKLINDSGIFETKFKSNSVMLNVERRFKITEFGKQFMDICCS